MTEDDMRAMGHVAAYDKLTGEAIGTATFDGGRMEWRWRCGAQRGWRKTGAKAVAAIEKATKSREEQRG
jgi:hypothetical protein